jgi:hypothetical protein
VSGSCSLRSLAWRRRSLDENTNVRVILLSTATKWQSFPMRTVRLAKNIDARDRYRCVTSSGFLLFCLPRPRVGVDFGTASRSSSGSSHQQRDRDSYSGGAGDFIVVRFIVLPFGIFTLFVLFYFLFLYRICFLIPSSPSSLLVNRDSWEKQVLIPSRTADRPRPPSSLLCCTIVFTARCKPNRVAPSL